MNCFLLGLVFARFSAPFQRAATIRFTTRCTISQHSSGYWAISLRVANMRKHQLLKPEIHMIVTALDSITPSNYVFEHLEVHNTLVQKTNLQLGMPATVVHVVNPASPLYSLSLQEMEARMFEIIVLVDGVDAMTSRQLQARFAYTTAEMALNEAFEPMHLEMRHRQLGLDFTQFDATTPLTATNTPLDRADARAAQERAAYLVQLRHMTFKRLGDIGGDNDPMAAAAVGAGVPLFPTDSGLPTSIRRQTAGSSAATTAADALDNILSGDNHKRAGSSAAAGGAATSSSAGVAEIFAAAGSGGAGVEMIELSGAGSGAAAAAASAGGPSTAEVRALCSSILADPGVSAYLREHATEVLRRMPRA